MFNNSCNGVYVVVHVVTPNLPTNIVGFRGFDSSTILKLTGGILRPRKVESSNVSRDNVSREIGRTMNYTTNSTSGHTSILLVIMILITIHIYEIAHQKSGVLHLAYWEIWRITFNPHLGLINAPPFCFPPQNDLFHY